MNGLGGHWIRTDSRWAIYLRDDWTCAWCGQKPEPEDRTLDHLYGRFNSPHNLVLACRSCNGLLGSERVETSVRRWPEAVERLKLRNKRIDRKAGAREYAAWREACSTPPSQYPEDQVGVGSDGALY